MEMVKVILSFDCCDWVMLATGGSGNKKIKMICMIQRRYMVDDGGWGKH